jgi:hypothetical protein
MVLILNMPDNVSLQKANIPYIGELFWDTALWNFGKIVLRVFILFTSEQLMHRNLILAEI